jgi:hypothetical protein
MIRMCAKCGKNPARAPQATVCSQCAKLGGKAPVDPEAAAAAARYDAEARKAGAKARPNIATNRRIREAMNRAAGKEDPQE